MKKETIVKVGADFEVKLPMETWKGIGVKPGDTIEFYNETGVPNEGFITYEYIKIRKQSTSNLEIPSKKYIEIQEMIDRKEIGFQTVEEAVEEAVEELLKELKK